MNTMGNINNEQIYAYLVNLHSKKKILVRTNGYSGGERVDFYEIIEQKSKTLFCMRHLKKQVIIANEQEEYFCNDRYFIPLDEYDGDIELIRKIEWGYKFIEFGFCIKKVCYCMRFEPLGEIQKIWDGYPVNYFGSDSKSDTDPELDRKYESFRRSMIRWQKLKKLKLI